MAIQTANVTAQPRSELGSRANKKLRDKGLLPGVVYGHKEAIIPITVNRKEVASHLDHGARLFDLSVNGKSEKVLVKEVQYDHLGIDPIHIDFTRVSLDEKVKVTIPIQLRGTPKGAEEGGVLQQIIATVEVECLVTEIPEFIRHSVVDMGMDAVLKIGDLPVPPGVRILRDKEHIVATVREILEVAPTEVAAEGPAEPEVIGRKPTEEEEAAAAEAAAAGGKAPAAAAAPAAKK